MTMTKRKRQNEWLPWYRARDYKGDLTEAEKRQLDAFRTQPTHPAANWDQLPEEVQDYIGRIELELYDHKQADAIGRAFFFGLVGAVLVVLKYFGCLTSPDWSYVGAAFLVVVPWFVYRRQWKKNAEEFLPSDSEAPRPTDEGIRLEWGLNCIAAARSAAKEASPPSQPRSVAP
jgi:hypothetical protein